ncbi:uncharacterized protein LOC107646667 [Arachis ipaensis]|uniref:Reverse transcriptase zinc-binding domain-containing protein n=1 Tax=Arachis hypogaea TaxID=3818 RepID=A0A445APH6_ARAHY|nr:uncharacterized protein LOC107646667 [Arachis ipaensis]XP_025627895.1 uncharacterized protein LOC112721021 [Arachis hypogaea]RYR28339.1 hypothetical protein Ahy_B01g052459 [Arachis hypogaea]
MLEEEKEWNTYLINQIFLPFEAQLHIPIPRFDQVDCFYWKKARDGEFRVKLAYHKLRVQTRSQSEISKREQSEEQTWKDVWRIRTPPRAVNFLWRLLHKSLLKKKNLNKRGINFSPLCPRCWEDTESKEHISRECWFARKFWFVSPFILRSETGIEIFPDVKEWVKEMMENIQSEKRGLFCTLLQQLWRAKNSLVFEEKSAPTEEEVQKSCMCFDEFWKAQMIEKIKRPIEKPQISVNQKWKCPPTNIMKINVDAVVPHDINGGVGVVIRDEMGIIMALATKEIPYLLEAHEAEAYAAFWD